MRGEDLRAVAQSLPRLRPRDGLYSTRADMPHAEQSSCLLGDQLTDLWLFECLKAHLHVWRLFACEPELHAVPDAGFALCCWARVWRFLFASFVLSSQSTSGMVAGNATSCIKRSKPEERCHLELKKSRTEGAHTPDKQRAS